MTIEQRNEFIRRIQEVNESDKAKFGKMNVCQMICHCSDEFRMMFGEFPGLKRQNVDIVKLKEMALKKEHLTAPEGLDQVAGGGTKPTELEKDMKTLIDYLKRFFECDDAFKFSFHPYFGEIDKAYWERLVIHHLNHHLGQFGR